MLFDPFGMMPQDLVPARTFVAMQRVRESDCRMRGHAQRERKRCEKAGAVAILSICATGWLTTAGEVGNCEIAKHVETLPSRGRRKENAELENALEEAGDPLNKPDIVVLART